MNIKYILLLLLTSCAYETQENSISNMAYDAKKQYNIITDTNIKSNNYQSLEEVKLKNKLRNMAYLEEQEGLGMLPYTCSPDRYPAYFILSNRSCWPYLKRYARGY